MAIVRMKRLRVMALAHRREELLGGLLHLGCVEISEPDLSDPGWSALLRRETSALTETRTEIADGKAALEALKRYAKVKDGLFIQRRQVTEQEFLDPRRRAEAQRRGCTRKRRPSRPGAGAAAGRWSSRSCSS